MRALDCSLTSDLVRTRDPAKLEKCDIVVDVGAVYDPAILRFDHHQRGFTENFGYGFVTKLSSAGLIYKFVIVTREYSKSAKVTLTTFIFVDRHYGKEIIANAQKLSLDSPALDTLYLKIYKVTPLIP